VSDASRTLRVIDRLRIEIDRDLCVGFGDCVVESPKSFELDDEGIAVFTTPEAVDRATLLEACAACPVDAITVFEDDVAIVP